MTLKFRKSIYSGEDRHSWSYKLLIWLEVDLVAEVLLFFLWNSLIWDSFPCFQHHDLHHTKTISVVFVACTMSFQEFVCENSHRSVAPAGSGWCSGPNVEQSPLVASAGQDWNTDRWEQKKENSKRCFLTSSAAVKMETKNKGKQRKALFGITIGMWQGWEV